MNEDFYDDIIERGTPVDDTHLCFMGKAPRSSALDRHPMGWYGCTLCGTLKAIRIRNVTREHTISCGCHGRSLHRDKWSAQARDCKPKFYEKVLRKVKRLRDAGVSHAAACARVAMRLRVSRYLIGFVWSVWDPIINYFESRSRQLRNAEWKAEQEAFDIQERLGAYATDPDSNWFLDVITQFFSPAPA